MPSSLTDANISDTYVGVLHANGQQLLSNGQSVVYDGYGNTSALSVGVSGNGITVTGPTTLQSLQASRTVVNTLSAASYVDAPNTPKAWALIQGNGTITAQHNVGSVVRNSTGDFTVYFTTAMPTANYAVSITMTHDNSTNKVLCAHVKSVPVPNTANFSFRTEFLNSGTTTAPFNPDSISITINHL